MGVLEVDVEKLVKDNRLRPYGRANGGRRTWELTEGGGAGRGGDPGIAIEENGSWRRQAVTGPRWRCGLGRLR